MAVPFVVQAIITGSYGVALVLLVVFASTDWVDGFLARALNQVSRFGALFDPAVDRVFIVAVAFALFWADLVPLWAVLLVVVRDVSVLLIAGVLLVRGVVAPAVSKLGKAGSFAVMTAAVLLVAAEIASGGLAIALRYVTVGVFFAGVSAAYIATLGYARALRSSVH